MIAGEARLSTLLCRTGISPVELTGGDPLIGSVEIDSRKVRPGCLFFALKGEKHDGTAYITEAVEKGAGAIASRQSRPGWLGDEIGWLRLAQPRDAVGPLARECFGRPDESMILVGITGTNGKTTVAYMVESMASAAGLTTGRIGTVAYGIGGVEREAVRTTPEAPDLFGMLADINKSGGSLTVLEVSSHALVQGRVGGARFSVAAFLNLGRDHLDFHGDRERYFNAKSLLFENLSPDAVAVLPQDDPLGMTLAARTDASLITFGRAPESDVRILEEESGVTGQKALLGISGGETRIHTPLNGRFNLDNAVAAVACAMAAGLPSEAAVAGLGDLHSVPGRMERIVRGQPFTLFVDYAHTEDALARSLESAVELAEGRVIVVFGCGGDRDRGKRGPMGAVAARLADLVVLTSDNPRTEDPERILSDILEGADKVARQVCRLLPDREEAIRSALSDAGPGDVVVIAGKGHETTQSFGDRVERFDDREVAGKILAELGWHGGGHA